MAKIVKQKKSISPEFDFNKKSHFSDYIKLNREYFGSNPSSLADEYNKSQKKPKKLARWLVNTLVICALVVFVVVTSVVCSLFVNPSGGAYVPSAEENSHSFTSLCVRPDDSSLIDVSSLDGNRKKAAYLYNLCSEKVTDAPYFTAYNKGLTYMKLGSSENYIDVDAVIMKTQSEYFNIEYHLKNSVPILDSFIGAAISKTTDVITTVRKYVGPHDKSMTYQKVKNNGYDENGVPYASWDALIPFSTPETKALPIPVFNSSQKNLGLFEITKHVVTEDTVSDADVSYNKKEKYYSVSLTLDPTNPATVINSIADIRSGTGDPDTYYTLIKLDFTVWDNGYFRTFDIVEKWDARVIISLSFELRTNWKCSYSAVDCNINRYPDATLMKKYLKQS